MKLAQENQFLNRKVETVEEKVEYLENDKRRKNVVVQGLEIYTDNQEGLKMGMEHFIENELEIKI